MICPDLALCIIRAIPAGAGQPWTTSKPVFMS
jgi:hypothetical protein